MLYRLVIALLGLASLALAAAACNGTAGDLQCVCQELRQALPNANGTVFPSDGVIYEEFEDVNYSAACKLPAACIVNPGTAQEVAEVMKILTKYETQFAVRSGGHNYNPGFASINESGVLISLSELDTLTLADNEKSIKVGSGTLWQDVYELLVPNWLVAIGARVGNVGVGGLVLGGGLSYFSSAYGLAMDNVNSFEVVLANGSIVNASFANENADLYKALRGGGSNFGIVTLYEIYTQPIADVTIDARAYAPNQTADFFKAFAQFQKQNQTLRSSLTVQILETGPTVLMVYTGDVEHPTEFNPFYAIKPYQSLPTTTDGTLLDILTIAASRFTNDTDTRVYGETFSHVADEGLLNDCYKIWVEETANLPANVTGTWVPNPISASVATLGKQNHGGNLLGLSDVAQVWNEPFITYTDPAHDELVMSVMHNVTERCTAAATAKKLDLPYLFANAAGMDQKVLQSYGNDSIAFMKTVAAKYDPTGVFQKLQKDGFLLRDVSMD
ncbi:FAD-binding domain-containing protein [Xylaria sp. CBS 124048]|nr:FAD-binding domain-containing protein [Xylaria sp. CBS 124048]